MSDHSKVSKLRWQCRRGVKELDVVFSEYLQNHYANSNKGLKTAFEELLQLEDPMLLALLYGESNSADQQIQLVVDKLKNLFTQ